MTNISFLTSIGSVILILMTVTFAYNSSALDDHSQQNLDKLVSQLDTLSDYTIHLSGHTDNTGKDQGNELLSQKRAIAVKDYLISRSIDSSKITISFHGEQQPLVSNNSEENKAMNRRVEITVEAQKQKPELPLLDQPTKQDTLVSKETDSTVKSPAQTARKKDVKKKKVRKRLVWTGWRTGFHWSTSGK